MNPKLASLISLLTLLNCSLFSQTARIRGNVFDEISKDGLPGTYILIVGTPFRTTADDKGNFEISGVPPGEYDLRMEQLGYTISSKHVTLKSGQSLRLTVGLGLDVKTMNEVTVLGEYRDKESAARAREKNAANIKNIISSQAMVRSPDINAANVLQRMSGITVQRSSGGDEAYAVIRGMEPRYNNTLVNGIKIASPDNKNRFVQLDIIPSDILSSIEISKSLTPDMEGDAIGGTVNMVVKDAPEVSSFKATASMGYSELFLNEKYIDFKKSDPFSEIRPAMWHSLPIFPAPTLILSQLKLPPIQRSDFPLRIGSCTISLAWSSRITFKTSITAMSVQDIRCRREAIPETPCWQPT
jgi:hypothetical protein